MAKIRVFTSSPAETIIPAGEAGAYFGQYKFVPVDGDDSVIEADVKDDAAIEFFLSTGNFFLAEDEPKAKAKRSWKSAPAAEAGGEGAPE